MGGARYSNWRDFDLGGPGAVGVLGAEYQASRNDTYGLSLFGEGRTDGSDFHAVFGGLRVYFGENKSLVRRHREDDPTGLVPNVEVIDIVPADAG